jgi:hypothetical protein
VGLFYFDLNLKLYLKRFEKKQKKKKRENNLPSYLFGPKAVGRPALPRLPAWAVQRRRVPAQQPSPVAKPAEPAARLLSLLADRWGPVVSRLPPPVLEPDFEPETDATTVS